MVKVQQSSMTCVERNNTVAHLPWREKEDGEFVATCATVYDLHTRWPKIYCFMLLEADAVATWFVVPTLAEILHLV